MSNKKEKVMSEYLKYTKCPQCNEEKVKVESVVNDTENFFFHYDKTITKYKCHNCGNEWEQTEYDN